MSELAGEKLGNASGERGRRRFSISWKRTNADTEREEEDGSADCVDPPSPEGYGGQIDAD